MLVCRRCPRSLASFVLAAMLCGCTATITTFPNQLRDDSGRPILLDEVEMIVNDDDLTDDEKRDALRDLGLEDEELIDALLTL